MNPPGLPEDCGGGGAAAGGTTGVHGWVCCEGGNAGLGGAAGAGGRSGVLASGLLTPGLPKRDFSRSSSCGEADFGETVPKMAVALDGSPAGDSSLPVNSGSSKGDLGASIEGYRIPGLSLDSGDQDYIAIT